MEGIPPAVSGPTCSKLVLFPQSNPIHEWAAKIQVPVTYLQLKFNETYNDYLIQTLVFLAGVELGKKIPA